MRYKECLAIVAFVLSVFPSAFAVEGEYAPENRVYQWRVKMDDRIDGVERQAFLWIPPSCASLNGYVFCGGNALEEAIIEDRLFRDGLEKLGFGIVWITRCIDRSALFDVRDGAQEIFDWMIELLVAESGYESLRTAPVVPLSHSAQASIPWNFAAWNPEKTLALISFHGDSPRSTFLCCNHHNPDWEDRNVDGIPSLICIGEHEWNDFRIADAHRFIRQYPASIISLLCNAGRGHGDFSNEDLMYLLSFIQTAYELRVPSDWNGEGRPALRPVSRQEGWLADRWHKGLPPSAVTNFYDSYRGNRSVAFWYPTETMARWTESIYERERNKKTQYISWMQDGRILKPGEQVVYVCDGHGMEVHARPVFVDSTYTRLSDDHSVEPFHIKRQSGPFQIVNDSTFVYSPSKSGLLLSGGTGIFAFSESDFFYGHAVATLPLRSPGYLQEGKEQVLNFKELENIRAGTVSVELQASSSQKLPVQFYVAAGPAYVEGNHLILTNIPPGSRFPVSVTVVAWQPGSAIPPYVKTAEPVERTLLITKK